MDYAQLLEGIKAHPYLTIITASVIKGQPVAVVAGALVAQGYVNPITAYCIFVVMDFLGDTLYYFFGRAGHLGGKFFMRKSWQKKLGRLHEGWGKNLPKALWIGKISIVGSKPVIFAAGAAKMPLLKFWGITLPCTLVLFILCMAIGYFFGQWIL